MLIEIYTCPSINDFFGKHYNTPYQGEKYNLKKLIDEVCAVQWTICHEQDDLPPLQIVYTPHVIDWYIIDIFSITMNEIKNHVFLCKRIIMQYRIKNQVLMYWNIRVNKYVHSTVKRA